MKPYFDKAKADQAVRFFKGLKHTKGTWAGVLFNLLPEQENRIRQIYGRMNGDGTRQIRTVYVEKPRKNGKSEEAAGHALKLLFADGYTGAEVYGAAYTREQAGIVHRVAAGMTRQSEMLRTRSKVIDSTKRIIFPRTNSFYVALPHEAASSQGFNPHGSVIDEYHVWKSNDLRDALAKGMGTTGNQPLEFIITTAGYDRSSPCYELHQYAEQVISGAIDDPTFYGEIWAAPTEADWTDEEEWKKCNPALGIFRNIEEMRKECQRAVHIPAEQNKFRQYYLNQWTQQSTRWISLDLWDAHPGPVLNEPDLVGRGFYGFLDLSAVNDLTAWVLCFPQDDPETIAVLLRAWCPESRLTDPQNQYRDQYQAWHRAGYLQTTPGNAIDYAFVKKQVIEDSVRFRLKRMNIDRLFQGAQLGMELAEELGQERVFSMGMGFMSFAAPMVEFERRLLAGKIRHGGNPLMRWAADSMAVKIDPAGNMKPDKATSQGKIDPIVGIVGAIDAQMRDSQGVTEWRAL